MPVLFDNNRHCDLDDVGWDATVAQAFIEQLYQATEQDFDPAAGWSHDTAIDGGALRFSLYDGDAGIAWSQAWLSRWGYGNESYNYQAYLNRIGTAQQVILNNELPSDEYLHGLLLGKLGLLVAESAFSFTEPLIDDLLSTMSKLRDNSVCEYMWGSPGALAVAAYHSQSRPKFGELAVELVNRLENQLSQSMQEGVTLWQQHLYGHHASHLGSVHGFAGNAFGILKARPLLDHDTVNRWESLLIDTITHTARVEGEWANWPQSIDNHRPGRDALLVQFCHGSPGIVSCLSELMGQNDKFDRLMLAGGELAWHAGPLKKGVNLCHGVAGTGYSFLKLFQATGDELWLERARAFAALGIHESLRQYTATGTFHFSLWNGDTGLGHFAHHCLNRTSELPTMDYF